MRKRNKLILILFGIIWVWVLSASTLDETEEIIKDTKESNIEDEDEMPVYKQSVGAVTCTNGIDNSGINNVAHYDNDVYFLQKTNATTVKIYSVVDTAPEGTITEHASFTIAGTFARPMCAAYDNEIICMFGDYKGAGLSDVLHWGYSSDGGANWTVDNLSAGAFADFMYPLDAFPGNTANELEFLILYHDDSAPAPNKYTVKAYEWDGTLLTNETAPGSNLITPGYWDGTDYFFILNTNGLGTGNDIYKFTPGIAPSFTKVADITSTPADELLTFTNDRARYWKRDDKYYVLGYTGLFVSDDNEYFRFLQGEFGTEIGIIYTTPDDQTISPKYLMVDTTWFEYIDNEYLPFTEYDVGVDGCGWDDWLFSEDVNEVVEIAIAIDPDIYEASTSQATYFSPRTGTIKTIKVPKTNQVFYLYEPDGTTLSIRGRSGRPRTLVYGQVYQVPLTGVEVEDLNRMISYTFAADFDAGGVAFTNSDCRFLTADAGDWEDCADDSPMTVNEPYVNIMAYGSNRNTKVFRFDPNGRTYLEAWPDSGVTIINSDILSISIPEAVPYKKVYVIVYGNGFQSEGGIVGGQPIISNFPELNTQALVDAMRDAIIAQEDHSITELTVMVSALGSIQPGTYATLTQTEYGITAKTIYCKRLVSHDLVNDICTFAGEIFDL